MMFKEFLFPLLLLLLTSVTDVCLTTAEIFVKEGDMVALWCPDDTGYNRRDTGVIWTSYTAQGMAVISNMSPAEQRQMGILVYRRNLVILSASVNHQGNYSCSAWNSTHLMRVEKNSQVWFRLTVYTTLSKENEDSIKYNTTCYTQESCKLYCPEVNIPEVNFPNMTSKDTVWYKNGEPSANNGFFSSVEEKDHGVYTCTRVYLYQDKIYNMTFIMVLEVLPNEHMRTSVITSPRDNEVFHVDLGSTVVIDCKAVVDPDFDTLYWLSDTSFVEMNDSLPVFYNNTQGGNTGQIKITASLVFKNVSEDDLSRRYTCRLDSVSVPSSLVTITLVQNARPSYVSLAVVTVSIVVVMTMTAVIYVKFKIDATLFLRDTLGCHRSPSDGKSYDAFLLCYDSDTDAGLKDWERKELENVLETFYGYNLCLFDRDVLPGRAEAEAVLECIEQSRTVVLVPSCPDSSPGSGLLSAVHAALVERQTHLVFIKTETTKVSTSGSLPEALQLLGEAGDCITWKNVSTVTPTSSFFKQLRYYLPAPKRPSNMGLLPQTTQGVTSW